jgi:small subunit ribosomal protein S29
MPGERKALRKRIVLSNTNALEVPMAGLDRQLSLTLENHVGSVVGLNGNTVDGLRAVEAFKTTQGWGLFRRPGVLVRRETSELAGRMLDASLEKKTIRMVVDGAKGSGKSMLLLQAMAVGFVREWIVLNIPEGRLISDANWDFADEI